MARGYPDFFGYSVFSRPGNQTIHVTGNKNVAAGIEWDLITVAGRGSLIGGWIEGGTTTTPGSQWIMIYVEGNLIESNSINTMLTYGESYDDGLLMGLNAYIPEIPVWEMRFTEGFVFNTELKIAFWNNSAGPITVNSGIWYYLIS